MYASLRDQYTYIKCTARHTAWSRKTGEAQDRQPLYPLATARYFLSQALTDIELARSTARAEVGRMKRLRSRDPLQLRHTAVTQRDRPGWLRYQPQTPT